MEQLGEEKISSTYNKEHLMKEEIMQDKEQEKKKEEDKRIKHWNYKHVVDKNLLKEFMVQCGEHTYLMPTKRPMNDYIFYFSDLQSRGLGDYLRQLSISIQPPNKLLNYLDSGAGQGFALNDFLSSRIEHVATGISLHPFPNIAMFLEKHKGRLDWIFDRAAIVLPQLFSNHYDLITDCWGSYFYSVERSFILTHYYRILQPGGHAYVIVDNKYATKIGEEDYESYLCSKWPKIFYLQNNKDGYRWLKIHKPEHGQSPPEINFDLDKFTIGFVHSSVVCEYPAAVSYKSENLEKQKSCL